MPSLSVKCPHCGAANNLGEAAYDLYNSLFAFALEHHCTACGEFFTHEDTSEADYAVIS